MTLICRSLRLIAHISLRLAAAAPLVVLAMLTLAASAPGARALTPIVVEPEQEKIEITTLGEAYEGRGDSLQVETAAGNDGVSGRMTVRASVPGANPNWMVFALSNKTDKSIERWLTADRYNIIGSGTIWPDLDARRVESVTPSIGFVPERIKSDRADVFRITLEPGQTITYVAELSSERYARIYLWKPIDYEVKTRDRQLFNGIMLGLTGLLAIFLTAVFAANHKIIFPAAALVSWSVLTYLCVDFGFFHKLFNLRPEDNAVYRAAGEAAMAASFVMFLTTFLRLGLWHGLVRMLIGVWVIAQLALVAVAVIDPRLAATFARLSFVGIGAVGALFTLYLAVRGQDRALSLIPTWVLFLVWIFATGMTLSGRLAGDMVVSSLVAGLVLVVILMGFTITQFAFRSHESFYAGAPTELQSRSLAIAGSGSAVWEWNIRRDEFKVGPEVEATLALMPGELSAKADDFIHHMHPMDQERFRVMLLSAQERAGVRIRADFRMRHADNSWRWFELEAASIPNADGRTLRCVGLMRDITNAKRAYERLLHDAVHCSLTGLPNRELFLDRLRTAVARAKTESHIRPAVLFVDIDKFKSVNSTFGMVRGDSMLLTVARRLQRHLGPLDTVARVGGDQFAMLFLSGEDARNLHALAERVRRSLRAPIPLANQEIVLTGSIGTAVWDNTGVGDGELLKEAEIAMYRAKRAGADRVVAFEPAMRRDRDERIQIESDLRKALDRNQLKVLYQPIVYLPTKELAGFEALVRWEHPKLGLLNPISFVPVAEESDLIIKLGTSVLLKSAHDAARWQSELPRSERPLFVSVNVSSRQIFRPESVQEIRHVLGRNIVPKGCLRLEVTETLVMENPEQSAEVLESLRGAGAELALDDFGTGYSSLAYLQRFPFDAIKIDRELVRGSSSPQGAAIMRSIVALAHELGKHAVAEGVEQRDEAAFLRSIGCEYAQGYHFGEPMPERDVLQLLKMIRKSERKMQPRGFFKAKTASKKKAATDKGAPEAAGVPHAGAAAPAGPDGTQAPRLQVLAKSVLRPRHKQTGAHARAGTADSAKPAAPLAIVAKNDATLPPLGLLPSGQQPSVPRSPPVSLRPVARSTPGTAPPVTVAPNTQAPDPRTIPRTQPPQPAVLQAPQVAAVPAGLPPARRSAPYTNGGSLPPAVSAPDPRTMTPPVPNGAAGGVARPLGEALARVTAGNGPGGSSAEDVPNTGRPMLAPPPPLPGQPQQQALQPDFSNLPPGVAASLARLAGVKPAPAKDKKDGTG
ncbi:MAG TPA: EAL domain-containing protein [Hyphomicrobium sp.]|nr:EAL domain-containing protein [Hyphomicrobium sp.]